MVITGIDLDVVHVNHRGDWLFVHVNTDEGIQGLGELRPGNAYEGAVGAVRAMAEGLKGRDPRRIREIWQTCSAGSPSRDEVCALSAVEEALWDILGKSLGVPLHVLLGGRVRDSIRLYANINRATIDRTPEGFARNAAAAVADGFDAVKLAPFDGMPRDVDNARDAEAGIACMEAVREAIGPEVDLLIDCHSRFTVRGALEVADALRDLDLFWYEQPTPETDLDDVICIKEQCGIPIAGGEQRVFSSSFREVMARGAMDMVMPDVGIVGGIGELKKVADMAEAWGVATAPHGPFGPVELAAGIETMATQPGFQILEFAWGEASWRSDLTLPAERIVNGRVSLSDRPGLGVELNPEVVDAHRVDLSGL